MSRPDANRAPAATPDPIRSRVVRMTLGGGESANADHAKHDRDYDIVIRPDALLEFALRMRVLTPRARRALLVADSGVPSQIVGNAVGSLAAAGIQSLIETVTPSEHRKSLSTVESLLNRALRERLEREEPFIALGGGVVGDMVGFAASIYRRGVPVIQCPTTLLAMVDASVGGKTGVNLAIDHNESNAETGGLRKNMVGAFWQPRLVLCDLRSLTSLPERDFRAGLAECLKHALMGASFNEPELLDWMLARVAQIAARDLAVLGELIARNVGIKARVVAGDERELLNATATGRAALNAGHTFAHAIESVLAGGSGVLHGEAVGLGIIGEVAVAGAIHSNGTNALPADQVAGWVQSLGLPARLPRAVPATRLIAAMHDDKKVSDGKLRLLVPTADRRVAIIDDPPHEALLAGLLKIGATR